MALMFTTIGSAADYGTFGRWLLLVVPTEKRAADTTDNATSNATKQSTANSFTNLVSNVLAHLV